MIISFHPSDASRLLINGKEFSVSLVQLHFEEEDDATELRDRIEGGQRMASQGRVSVSQLIDVSREWGLSIPDTLAESGENQVPESDFPDPGSHLQNEAEETHDEIQRIADSISPDGSHESVSLINEYSGASPAKSTVEPLNHQLQKPSTARKQAPTQTIAPRRPPRFQKPLDGIPDVTISHSHNVAQARLEEAETLSEGTSDTVAPDHFANTIPPPEMPIPTVEADMTHKAKNNAMAQSVDGFTPFNSLSQRVRRSPQLAKKASRISTRVHKTKAPSATTPLGLSQAADVRAFTPLGKERKAEQPLPKNTDAITASRKSRQQNQEAQAAQSRKSFNGGVTKGYSSKEKGICPVRPRENEGFPDDPDLWEIPSDEYKIKSINTAKSTSTTKSTKKKGLDGTVKSQPTSIRNGESKGQRAGKLSDGADISNKAQSSNSLQRDDTDEYVPSQRLPQASYLTDTTISNNTTRVLRSSVRKAKSQQNLSIIFHELSHRTLIRKKSPRKSVFKANQKVARLPPKTSLIGAEVCIAVKEHLLNDSGRTLPEKASAAAEAAALSPKFSGQRHGHEDVVPNAKTKYSEVPEFIEHYSTSRTDGVASNDHNTEVSRLLASNKRNIPQDSANLITDDRNSAHSGNQPVQGSLGLLSNLLIPNIEPRFDPLESAKEDTCLSFGVGNDVQDEFLPRALPLQRSCPDNGAVDTLCFQQSPTSYAQSARTILDGHTADLAEKFQGYFESATAFNDFGGSEHSTLERTPPPVRTNTLVAEDKTNQSVPQRLSPTSAFLENDPKFLQPTKDSFASKVASVLQDATSVRRNETSKTSRNARQHTESLKRPQKVTKTAQSVLVSRDTAGEIGEVPLSISTAKPIQPVVAIAIPVNLQSNSDRRALRDTSQELAMMHTPPDQEKSNSNPTSTAFDEILMVKSRNRQYSPQKLNLKNPSISLIDPYHGTGFRYQQSLLELTSNEGSLGQEKSKASTTLPRSKRKANEKAEGDIKRLCISPTERAIYITPSKRLAADVPRGKSTTSPLTNERHYRKPTIITFSGNGPRNQGKKMTPNELPKPQIEYHHHLVDLPPPSSGKRKRHGEVGQQGQEAVQEDSRKRLKHLRFSLPSSNKQSFSLVDMPSTTPLENERFDGSQSTRVTSEGSPVAAKQYSHDNHCISLIPRMISEFVNREGERVDEGPPATIERPGSNIESFYGQVVKLPDLPNRLSGHPHQRKTKSGYGKLLPSTPTAPSRMLTELAAHTVEPDGRFFNLQTHHVLCETEIPDPFAEPKALGIHTEKAQLPNANSFLERLRKSVVMTQRPTNPVDDVDEHATKAQDPDKTLIGVEEQGRGRAVRSQGSPDSSHSSSSASTKSRCRSPSRSDGPGDSPNTLNRRKWRAALKPHQAETRRILEEMSDVGSHYPLKTHKLT